VDAGPRLNNGNQAFWSELSAFFDSEEFPSMGHKTNHEDTRDGTTTHRQLINVQSLFLWHGARPKEVPQKM
jgi:hypothetical protein